MNLLIIAAGVVQVMIAISSLGVPIVLDWRADTARLHSLTRQVFWTYAAYIWKINLSMGLLSIFASDVLLDGSSLGC